MIGMDGPQDEGCMTMEDQNDQRRRHALLALLSAGMPTPPTRALLVEALAEARRSVAAHQARHRPFDGWFAEQIRLRGIKESAAFVAALEIADRRAEIAELYRRRYPDRQRVLGQFLTALDAQPSTRKTSTET